MHHQALPPFQGEPLGREGASGIRRGRWSQRCSGRSHDSPRERGLVRIQRGEEEAELGILGALSWVRRPALREEGGGRASWWEGRGHLHLPGAQREGSIHGTAGPRGPRWGDAMPPKCSLGTGRSLHVNWKHVPCLQGNKCVWGRRVSWCLAPSCLRGWTPLCSELPAQPQRWSRAPLSVPARRQALHTGGACGH